MPHTIRPKRYLVEVSTAVEAGEAFSTTYEVRVIAADILKAEEVAPTYGIVAARSPIAMNLLWIWAASRRERKSDLSWPDFREALLDWLDVNRATSTEEETVDPTRPAGLTPSPSPSPSASEASTSTGGSAPSSTTRP